MFRVYPNGKPHVTHNPGLRGGAALPPLGSQLACNRANIIVHQREKNMLDRFRKNRSAVRCRLWRVRCGAIHVAIVSCSTIIILLTPAVAVSDPIKVMSFNVRFDFGAPSDDPNAWVANSGTGRRERALTVIDEIGPDILGVQEPVNQQLPELQAALEGYEFYGTQRVFEAVGIFYRADRFQRIDQGTFWLSLTPDTPSVFETGLLERFATWAVLQDQLDPEKQYFVLNTHWSHQSQDARLYSADLIRQRIKSLAGNAPLIVMGDLNVLENNAAYFDLIGANDPSGFQLLDSYREMFPVQQSDESTSHGFSGNATGQRIDYVLHNSLFNVKDAAIVRTSYDGRYPSDHFPVTAVLSLIPEPTTSALALAALCLAMSRRRILAR